MDLDACLPTSSGREQDINFKLSYGLQTAHY